MQSLIALSLDSQNQIMLQLSLTQLQQKGTLTILSIWTYQYPSIIFHHVSCTGWSLSQLSLIFYHWADI